MEINERIWSPARDLNTKQVCVLAFIVYNKVHIDEVSDEVLRRAWKFVY